MSKIHYYLKDLKSLGRPIYYCPNPGNGGDSIIASATFQLFKNSDIKFKLCALKDLEQRTRNSKSDDIELSDIILVFGGGGNLVNNYNGLARTFLENYHSKVFKFVLLPHTINTHIDLLKKIGSNVDLICREEVSYNYVRDSAPSANVLLMDDLAFSLDIEKLLNSRDINYFSHVFLKSFYKLTRNDRSKDYISPKSLSKHELMILKRRLERKFTSKGNILNAFRTDSERTYLSLPSDNIDVSRIIQYGTHQEILAFQTTKTILNFINLFDKVRTNRLHIAVPSALLGKKVNFYANNYYKCKAIYDYSMKDRFPNVTWITNQDEF